MTRLVRRKGPSQFQRASDGSMTLMEHLRELRSRLFKACFGRPRRLDHRAVHRRAGAQVPATSHTATSSPTAQCQFNVVGPIDPFAR